MTEILLLGTFHFMESPIAFYSDKVQDELEMLAQKLLRFSPDAIAVEAAKDAQSDVDRSYHTFCLNDLRNVSKMQTETLGEIHMFGGTYPITYNNECIQIGYRIGKLAGLEKIHAIDDDTVWDTKVMHSPTPCLNDAMKALRTDEDKHTDDSLLALYRYYNGVEWSNLNHAIYIQMNAISTDHAYAGAQAVAKWYERNLKIFSNIQRISKNSKRLFILYGAGHLQILRELIHADNHLKLVDVYDYL
ncbi:MAG: hypothetical protein IJW40_05720 [Clostridia bacterium]|nr:hypothetical protein [Clostridia bacterium]